MLGCCGFFSGDGQTREGLDFLHSRYLRKVAKEERQARFKEGLAALAALQDSPEDKKARITGRLQSTVWGLLDEKGGPALFNQLLSCLDKSEARGVVESCLIQNRWRSTPDDCHAWLIAQSLAYLKRDKIEFILAPSDGDLYLSRAIMFRSVFQPNNPEELKQLDDGLANQPLKEAYKTFAFGLWIVNHFPLSIPERQWIIGMLNHKRVDLNDKAWWDCFWQSPDAFIYCVSQSKHLSGAKRWFQFIAGVLLYPVVIDLYYRLVYPAGWLCCGDERLENGAQLDHEAVTLPLAAVVSWAGILITVNLMVGGAPWGACLLAMVVASALMALLVTNLLRHYCGHASALLCSTSEEEVTASAPASHCCGLF